MKPSGKQKKLGQYFTQDVGLLDAIFRFIKNDATKKILEPCIGRGNIVSHILEKLPDAIFDMFEIDGTLEILPNLKDCAIVYCDFLKTKITETYDTIVGNPPFVRTKKGNLYIDFIEKCYRLLNVGGELIFIVPSDFFKLTSSVKIIEEMMLNGTFTDIYHPNKENLFQFASVDILVFRYCKRTDLQRDAIYNGQLMKLVHNNGLITFTKEVGENARNFSDVFNIYVGLVSGREEVFKNAEFSNMKVLNGKEVLDKYIFVEAFPTDNNKINDYLLKNKDNLITREIRKFTEKNWFEWGAPRNIKIMKANAGKPCIYVYNLTRQEKVAFIGQVQYFGGGLLMLVPKEEILEESLEKYVDYLNSAEFKQSFTFSGRFKIGQRQLCNCKI